MEMHPRSVVIKIFSVFVVLVRCPLVLLLLSVDALICYLI